MYYAALYCIAGIVFYCNVLYCILIQLFLLLKLMSPQQEISLKYLIKYLLAKDWSLPFA